MEKKSYLFFSPWILIITLVFTGLSSHAYQPPHPEQFKGWKFDQEMQAYGTDLKTLNKVTLQCEDKTLIPTHPQQDTKKYHLAIRGDFGKTTIWGGPRGAYGDICRLWTNNNIEARRSCLAPRTLHYAILSDLYQDRCGNQYRGYFIKIYFSDDETMGTLVSLGKTFYENPYSPFRNTNLAETYVGGTYPLNAADFIYFTNLTNQEKEQIIQNIQMAATQGQTRDVKTGLFNDAIPKKY